MCFVMYTVPISIFFCKDTEISFCTLILLCPHAVSFSSGMHWFIFDLNVYSEIILNCHTCPLQQQVAPVDAMTREPLVTTLFTFASRVQDFTSGMNDENNGDLAKEGEVMSVILLSSSYQHYDDDDVRNVIIIRKQWRLRLAFCPG